MRTIALTGGIASGKSTVSAMLKRLGAFVIDADELSRASTAPGGEALPAIRQAFGGGVFDGEALDRKALAAVVFADDHAREMLNAIIHPIVYRCIEERRQEALGRGEQLVVLDIPLLFETGMDTGADEVWLVDAPEDQRIERILRRDGMTIAEAKARMQAQMPMEEKRALADVIIENGADLAALEQQVRAQLARLTGKEEHGKT